MAKARMLSRTIATDAKFNKLNFIEQWLFMRMIPFADDYGRLPGNLIELKLLCIPGSSLNNVEIEDILIKFDSLELIYFDKNKVIEYRSWLKNQTFTHKRTKSKFPTPRQHIREKTRKPDKIAVSKKIYKANKDNIKLSFDDFWALGLKKTDKKKCKAKWLEISDEGKRELMKHARRFVKGKKGLPHPYTYLAYKKWEKVIPSNNANDFTEISHDLYSAYCSECSRQVYPSREQLNSESSCCEARLVPHRPFQKVI